MKLNKDIGIIFRNYDKPDDKEVLLSLKKFCKKNQRKLYLANNFKMAVNLDLDGVYIPSYNKKLRIKNFTLKKNFLILGSAHNLPELLY